MKDLKFRIWDKQAKLLIVNEIWIYTDPLHVAIPNYKKYYSEEYLDSEPSNIEYGDDWIYLMDDFVLMLYSEIKDKNGKEIYEGDIVICDRFNTHEKYQVVIEDVRFIPDILFGSELNYREIIGNIFENPELLQE